MSVRGFPIGFIGVGEIAAAIVEGLATHPVWCEQPITLSPRGAYKSSELAERFDGVHVSADNQGVIDSANVLVVAVRPDDAVDTILELALNPGQILVSVIAGIDIDTLGRLVPKGVAVVRATPLPSVRDHAGTTTIFPASTSAEAAFHVLGEVIVMDDERSFETLSVLTGTLSTHLQYMDCVAQWAKSNGIPDDTSEQYVRSLYAGLHSDLQHRSGSLADLMAAHETAGGLNETLRMGWLDRARQAALHDGMDRLRDLERGFRAAASHAAAGRGD